jgi:hypothetical protein
LIQSSTYKIHLFTALALVLYLSLAGCWKGDSSGLPPHVQNTPNLTILSDSLAEPLRLHFVKERIYEDSLLLDQITALLVDDNGRVFIGGERWGKRQVHIFQSDGSYSDSLGSMGSGFGEFRSIDRIQLMDSDLFLFDETLNRVSRFYLESKSWADTTNFYSGRFGQLPHADADHYEAVPAAIFKDGTFLIAFKQKRNPAYEPNGVIRYYRTCSEERIHPGKFVELRDKHFLVGDYAGRPAPFTLKVPERPLFEVSGGGELYFAHTDEFFIRVMNRKGEILRAFYYPYERKPMNPNEVIHPRFSHNDQLLRIRKSAKYPETWPALYSIVTDDENRIWISTITDNRDELKWWVIDEHTGTLLTRFTWPFERPISYVKNGAVYSIEQNDMGFKQVVKYRVLVEMNGLANE